MHVGLSLQERTKNVANDHGGICKKLLIIA